MPKVTVILTSYNHAKYIRETIDSILNQTFKDFELIIWDDASTDESWDIIKSYNDERIKSFRNNETKRGVYGINKTISEIFLFIVSNEKSTPATPITLPSTKIGAETLTIKTFFPPAISYS